MEDPEVVSGEGELSNEEFSNGTDFFLAEDGTVTEAQPQDFLPQDVGDKPTEYWSVQGIWNEITTLQRRVAKTRDYISFSDIGKSDKWSRYMKMKGVEETNPVSDRVGRIFEAGHEFHALVKTVFKKAGIYINSQDDLDEQGNLQFTEIPATSTTLKQYGMYDILVGGIPNLQAAEDWIKQSDLSHFAKEKALRIATYFAEKFPTGLKPMIYEVKSINSQAFWAKKAYLSEAYAHHRHQAYGYLLGNTTNEKALEMVRARGVDVDSIDEARILYVSKDDLTVAEFPIKLGDQKLAESYAKDISEMSYYILNNIEPPKPAYVVFNPRKTHKFQHLKKAYRVKGCWEPNWEVTWSPYFTLMTGFKTEEEFEASIKETISEKNKAIKAAVLGKVGLSVVTKEKKSSKE